MQSRVLKIVKLSLFLLLFTVVSQAQSNNPMIMRADSLFQQKRYIQSLELYQKLFDDHRYTPAMLLRMAYVEEGLNNISRSVYYLNLYYLATQDEDALIKLEEMGAKHKLAGYETEQTDGMRSFYLTHLNLITGVLLFALVLAVAVGVTQRFMFKSKPVGEFVAVCIIAALFIAHLTQQSLWAKAIIAKNNTYLMTGPSAGASVKSIMRDGHRVEVMGTKDVWTKIRISGNEVSTEGYVRSSSLLPVKL